MVNKKSLATFVRTVGNQAIAGFKHFLNNVKIGGTLTINAETLTTPATSVLTLDGNNVVRSATAFAGISVDATSKIKHEVKAGVAINKGQAVYVTSADGTNMIVGLASNATEATSSKTMGLMETTVAINGKGNVITEGLLDGLDTSAATIGDPVWLGTNGNLIYGIANKPFAPAHMVAIGIVTRVNANNGEIFVKVQNGFELEELHNVQISTPTTGQLIRRDSDNLWKNWTPNFLVPSNVSGTTNYVSKFTDTNTVGNSQIFDNGTNVGIGTATPGALLQIGNASVSTDALTRLSVSYNTSRSSRGGITWHDSTNNTGRIHTEYDGAIVSMVFGSLYNSGYNSNELMILRGNGNLGIGTNTPSERLHVNGRIRVATVDNGVGDFLTISATGVITDRTAAQVLTDIGAQPLLTNPVIGSGTSTRVAFWNNSNSLSSNANLFWDNTNSRLGIGTATPQQALHVNGIGRFDSHVFVGANVSTADTYLEVGSGRTGSGYAYIDLVGDTTYSDYGLRFIRNNTGANASSEILHRGTGDLNITTVNASNMRLLTGSTERLRITSGGNVGINNTNPSFALDVTGDIRSSATLRSTNLVSTNSTVRNYYVDGNGVPTSNLGNPTVTEMAIFDEQFDNKTAFYSIASLKFYTSTDNINWTEYTTPTDQQKRRFLGGDNYAGINIPNLTPYFRIEITNSGSYVFLNALYLYWSSQSHSTTVKIRARRRSDLVFVQWTNSNSSVSAWPGHLYLPFSTIPFLTGGTSSGHYDIVQIDFQPTWSGNPTYGTLPIILDKLQLWGGYPAAKRNIYFTDESANVTFPATLNSTRLVSTVATGTAPLTVTSTTRVANLNVATAGTADTFTTARSINGTSFNGSADITTANWGTGRTITIGSTGKSVNGSANVSWSLAEIGAQPAGSYLTAEADTLQSVTTRGSSTTTGASFGGTLVVGNATSGNAIIEVGQNRTANGFALIDLVGDTTYTDYGLRLIRHNTGANSLSQLVHRGTGNLDIATIDIAPIVFKTIDTERARIASNGNFGINTTSPSQALHVVGGARITGAVYDSANQPGTAGQVLSSTGTGTQWITSSGGGGGSTISVSDEGTSIGTSFTTLNFIGDNVSAGAIGSTAIIEVTGRASTGSIYYDDIVNPFVIPGGGFADVEINTQTVLATVPSSLTTSNKLIASITFGVNNVSNFDEFNGFKFRLYNNGPMSAIQGSTHSWTGYMSKASGCTTTIFTFHIPIDANAVTSGDIIVVQADTILSLTPEIYYCSLTFIEGTN